MTAARTVGLLGGGVIGGGWAARFALNGIDVRLYDPDPEAERKVGEVLANARSAYTSLTHAPLPLRGRHHPRLLARGGRRRRRSGAGERARARADEARAARARVRRRAGRRDHRVVDLRAAADAAPGGHAAAGALLRRAPVQPGVPAAARRDLRRRPHRPGDPAAGRRRVRRRRHVPARPRPGDRRVRGGPPARGALARGALARQRRHRDRQRDRRRDPLSAPVSAGRAWARS